MLRYTIIFIYFLSLPFTVSATQVDIIELDTNILGFKPTQIPEYPDAHYVQKFRDLSVDMEFRFTPQIKKQILYRTNTIRSATEKHWGVQRCIFLYLRNI